ncbi:MAG: hypothetical protein RLZZ437_3290 [Pseudomonadota bacterium]
MSDLWATAMGTWCGDLADLMLPFDRLPLTRADLVFMGSGTPGFSYAVADPCPEGFSQVLKSDLALAMAHYPMGAHLRLDLCSFRSGAATPRVVGANGALWLLRQPNPRVSGVIRRGLADGQALSLFLFPWLPIPPWAEFRIFVRQGAVVGVSQYHPQEAFPQIAQHETAIRAAIDAFVASALPRLGQPDLALDVLAEPVPQGGFRMRLVDLSVLGPRTDPCLFSWENEGDFDGSFRFRKPEVTLTMPVPAAEVMHEEQTQQMPLAPAPSPAPDDDVWRI